MAVPPRRVDPVDERVDHPAGRLVGTGAVFERPQAEYEPVVEDVRLEAEPSAVDRRRHRRGRECELVDPVDGQVEPRAEPAEDERDHARSAQAGGDCELDRVRHMGVTTIESMSASLLTLSTEQTDGVSVIHVAGDLDLSTVGAFDAELEQSLESEHLVIELGECTFIDSSALRALVRAQKQVTSAGGELALVASSQPARRVLEIATLDRFVPVFGTLGEAVTSFA